MRRFVWLWLLGVAASGCWALAACDSAGARAGRSPEGRWIAHVPPKLYCSSSRLTLDVRRATIVGNVVNSEGVFTVSGAVDAGGTGVIRIGGVAGVIRFGADRFVADYPNLRCGFRRAVGFRIG